MLLVTFAADMELSVCYFQTFVAEDDKILNILYVILLKYYCPLVSKVAFLAFKKFFSLSFSHVDGCVEMTLDMLCVLMYTSYL